MIFKEPFYLVVIIRKYVEIWENSERMNVFPFLVLCQFPQFDSLWPRCKKCLLTTPCGVFLWSLCALSLSQVSFPSSRPPSSACSTRAPGPPPWLQPLCSVIQSAYCCQILPLKNLCQRIYFWLKFEPLGIFIITERNYHKKFGEQGYFHAIVAFSQFNATLEISPLVPATADLPMVCGDSNLDTFFR